jgi:ribosomal protein S18 acetylase RimI-like enzyme
MFDLVQEIAHERRACKLTLEVLAGNESAQRLYARIGFAQYQLSAAVGAAQFLQKWLS